jgi:hypothetical protein
MTCRNSDTNACGKRTCKRGKNTLDLGREKIVEKYGNGGEKYGNIFLAK